MKRRGWIILGIALMIGAVWFGGREGEKQVQIGVSLYLEDDTFVEKILTAMEEEAAIYEAETGTHVALNVSIANGSQRTQNEQVKRYIELGYDAVCVNLVDRTSAASIVDLAATAEQEIPVIFFNREPVAEDIMRREGVYYVGSDAKESALLQGLAVISAYEKKAEIMDKNGDGVLQYVMLEGEMGHQDTIMRSDYSVQRIHRSGIVLQKLASGTADWSRRRAAVLMEQWIDEFGHEIELVLCNNDDMALGALDVLGETEISSAVFGIDATEVGMEAVTDGGLWGTVDCNAQAQGAAVLRLAAELGLDPRVTPEALGVEIVDERYVRVPLKMLLAETP